MKLIYCQICGDVRKLAKSETICACGASWGNYKEDGLNANIHGEAIPLGFDNSGFMQCINQQPEKGQGKVFCAFVIPKECPTIKVM